MEEERGEETTGGILCKNTSEWRLMISRTACTKKRVKIKNGHGQNKDR
jgi:hypothetical protein